MRKAFFSLLFSLTLASLVLAIPQYINYQGLLKNSAGSLESGTFSMVFKIYDAAAAGTAVYNSGGTATSVNVSDGIYNVQLGTVDAAVFTGDDRWLDITVAGEQLTPRLKINSVAYAYYSDTASNAATVDNLSASSTATANQLYPLDSSARLSGVGITAEASGTNYALFINGGKIGFASGGAGTSGDHHTGCVGSGTIPSGSGNVQIYNDLITDNSIILITLNTRTTSALEPLVPYAVSGGTSSFRVGFTNTSTTAPTDVSFNYLVVN